MTESETIRGKIKVSLIGSIKSHLRGLLGYNSQAKNSALKSRKSRLLNKKSYILKHYFERVLKFGAV